MVEERVQRRLAAILAADVAGYSRLMGEDEEATLQTLKTYREVIDGLVANHDGRVFGGAGDSIIAEFASPVEAVRCATEIQHVLKERNAELPEERRMRFRIGVNLGDVMADGDGLFGDGVNIAARLEDLAEPGGICVSGATYDHIKAKVDIGFVYLGEQRAKNIQEPITVYQVLIDPGGQHPLWGATGAARRIGPYGTIARGIVGAGFVVGALAAGVSLSDAAVGLVVFPAVVLSALGLVAHSSRPLRLYGWSGHCLNFGIGAAAFSASPVGALPFYGGSTLLGAIRGYAGCEVFAVPNWLRRRDDQISCAVFSPIDNLEARARRRAYSTCPASSVMCRVRTSLRHARALALLPASRRPGRLSELASDAACE